MKYIIVITGASSGFGELTVQALAKAGHIVYASMRETAGRNKEQVKSAAQFAAENNVDLRTIELDVSSEELPPDRKRSFHRTMVGAVVPSLCLIVRKEAPSASIRISLAQNTYPAGSERD